MPRRAAAGRHASTAGRARRARLRRTASCVALTTALGGTILAAATPAAAAVDADGTITVADAYTLDNVPSRTTGDATKVAVGYDGWSHKVGYLKFATGSATSSGVELVLQVSGGSAGTLEVHRTSADWSEATLTGASAPAVGSRLATAALTGGAQRVVVPLGAAATAGGDIAVALVVPGDALTRIASRESGSGAVLRLSDAAVAPPPPAPTGSCSMTAKLVASCGAWLGVAPTMRSGESYGDAITRFERDIARPVDITHWYARGQSTMFPTGAAMANASSGGVQRLLFYNWRPTGYTWRQLANGAADGFLRNLAQHIKTTWDRPFFLSLNAEPEEEVNPTAGSGQTAADFAAFFRHTVQVLRGNGATKIVTVMNYIGAPHWGDVGWFGTLYPGDDVVDWIAEDPYAFGSGSVWLSDFAGMVDRRQNPSWSTYPGFYSWAQRNHPSKPIMLGEWGVDDPVSDPTYKPRFFDTAAAQLARFPALKALVYWDHPGGTMVGPTTVTSSTASQAAARRFAAASIVKLAGDVNLR